MRTRITRRKGAAALVSALLALPLASAGSEHQGHPGEFDFLLGNWKVHNSKLVSLNDKAPKWVRFEAIDRFHVLPADMGTEEDYQTEHWPGFRALGLHLYNSATAEWTLYWADNRNAPGTMQTLAKGRFEQGKGVFFGKDEIDGRPVDVRVIWQPLGRDQVRWEQAISFDKTQSWTTNWVMEFERD